MQTERAKSSFSNNHNLPFPLITLPWPKTTNRHQQEHPSSSGLRAKAANNTPTDSPQPHIREIKLPRAAEKDKSGKYNSLPLPSALQPRNRGVAPRRGRWICEMEVSWQVGEGESGVKGVMFVVINACYVGKVKCELSFVHVTLEDLDQSCHSCMLRWKS